jgi:hypothetical protein
LTKSNELRRAKLVRNLQSAVEAYKFRYQVCTTEKLLRQQEEMLDLKRRKIRLKEKEMIVRTSGNTENPLDAVDSEPGSEDIHVHAAHPSVKAHEPSLDTASLGLPQA